MLPRDASDSHDASREARQLALFSRPSEPIHIMGRLTYKVQKY